MNDAMPAGQKNAACGRQNWGREVDGRRFPGRLPRPGRPVRRHLRGKPAAALRQTIPAVCFQPTVPAAPAPLPPPDRLYLGSGAPAGQKSGRKGRNVWPTWRGRKEHIPAKPNRRRSSGAPPRLLRTAYRGRLCRSARP